MQHQNAGPVPSAPKRTALPHKQPEVNEEETAADATDALDSFDKAPEK